MTHTPPPTQDDLAAGRELDALVGLKVMRLRADLRTARHLVAGYDDPEGWGDPDSIWEPVPSYSTDIGAAFQVLAGWSVTLAHAEGLPWHCHLMRCTREGKWQNGEGHADTAPLAICAAALKAVSAQP